MNLYFDALFKELNEILFSKDRPFETVFIGGGNPGLLGAERLMKIARLLNEKGKVREFTIEMNPESLTDDMEVLFSSSKVTRLSIGIQSLDERHLKTLMRSASLSATLKALERTAYYHDRYGTDISVDLMTCIPSQKVEDTIADIDTIIRRGHVDHISLYNLTYEEGTKLAERLSSGSLIPIAEEQQREFLITLWDYLEENGYHQYEISNFSRTKETRCLHNERYWNLSDYIGVGPSAVGTFHDGESVIRRTGVSDIETYCTENDEKRYIFEELSTKEQILECLLVSLRKNEGIDKNDFNKRFPIDFSTFFSTQLKMIERQFGSITVDTRDNFRLLRDGLLLCDSFIELFADPVFDLSDPLDR